MLDQEIALKQLTGLPTWTDKLGRLRVAGAPDTAIGFRPQGRDRVLAPNTSVPQRRPGAGFED